MHSHSYSNRRVHVLPGSLHVVDLCQSGRVRVRMSSYSCTVLLLNLFPLPLLPWLMSVSATEKGEYRTETFLSTSNT